MGWFHHIVRGSTRGACLSICPAVTPWPAVRYCPAGPGGGGMGAARPSTPGWVVDVVLAAARRAGVALSSVGVSFNDDGTLRDVRPHLWFDEKDAAAAVALFAALGVTATVGEPYGPFDHLPGTQRQADVEAFVPVLGAPMVLIVTDGLPGPDDATDVATLTAEVDAAHTAAVDPTAALPTRPSTAEGV